MICLCFWLIWVDLGMVLLIFERSLKILGCFLLILEWFLLVLERFQLIFVMILDDYWASVVDFWTSVVAVLNYLGTIWVVRCDVG